MIITIITKKQDIYSIVNEKLFEVFNYANESNLVSEKLYIDWIDWILLSKDKKESKLKIAQQIAKKSIDVYPNCTELWNRRTSISTNIDDGHVIISYEEDFFNGKVV